MAKSLFLLAVSLGIGYALGDSAPSVSVAPPELKPSAATSPKRAQAAGLLPSDVTSLPPDADTGSDIPSGTSRFNAQEGPYLLLDPSDAGRDDRFSEQHGFPRPRGGSTADPEGASDDTLSPTSPGAAGTVPGASSSAFATGGFPITIPPLHAHAEP